MCNEPQRREPIPAGRDEIRRGAPRQWKIEYTSVSEIPRDDGDHYEVHDSEDNARESVVSDYCGMPHREPGRREHHRKNRRRPPRGKLRVRERFFACLKSDVAKEFSTNFTSC